MASITSIADRLTPSNPTEITFGAQLTSTGTKMTTLFGHRAATGGLALDYDAVDVVNVGDPAAAKAEVDLLAGVDSQIGFMAKAFVESNTIAGRSVVPPFRVVLLPFGETGFGPADEALNAIKGLRSDMLVSPYPLSDSTRLTTLNQFRALISGVDRNLTGQFGSFITVASISPLATAVTELAAVNSRGVISAILPDTNTALVNTTATTVLASNQLTALASVAGIYPGASVTGTGIPAGTVVESVRSGVVTLSKLATAAGTAVALAFQNKVSQPVEIIAAKHAAAMMATVFPYRPHNGLELGGLVQPRKPADLIYVDPAGASEQILKAGGSPIRVLPGKLLGLLRTRTNYTLLPDGVTAANAYTDWIDLIKLQDFKESMYAVLQNPPFNNNPGGALLSLDLGEKLNDEAIRIYFEFQKGGAFQAASSLTKQIVVQNSTTNRGTLEFRIPANAIPGLYVTKGNIVGVTDFDFTF